MHFKLGFVVAMASFAVATACGDDDGGTPSGSGGASSTGGASGSGGAKASGGTASTGGAKASGGTVGAGGGPSSGGVTASGGATATGGTKASGGTSSSGGAASGGTDGGDSPDASTSLCDQYCDLEETSCGFTGANKQFDNRAACDTACAAYPATGQTGATGGDTVQCRIYHVTVAGESAANATTHCPHTGVTPTGFCVN
jgi:hypothetical protein